MATQCLSCGFRWGCECTIILRFKPLLQLLDHARQHRDFKLEWEGGQLQDVYDTDETLVNRDGSMTLRLADHSAVILGSFETTRPNNEDRRSTLRQRTHRPIYFPFQRINRRRSTVDNRRSSLRLRARRNRPSHRFRCCQPTNQHN